MRTYILRSDAEFIASFCGLIAGVGTTIIGLLYLAKVVLF